MLVLSRRPGEEVMIGEDIRLTVVSVAGNHVRLGITAPDQVPILRSELCAAVRRPKGPCVPALRPAAGPHAGARKTSGA